MPFCTSDTEKLNTMFPKVLSEKIPGAIWVLPVRCPSVRSGRWRWSHLYSTAISVGVWWTLGVFCGIIGRGPSIQSQDTWILRGKAQGIHFLLAQIAAGNGVSSKRGGTVNMVASRSWSYQWNSGSSGFLTTEVAAAILVVSFYNVPLGITMENSTSSLFFSPHMILQAT